MHEIPNPIPWRHPSVGLLALALLAPGCTGQIADPAQPWTAPAPTADAPPSPDAVVEPDAPAPDSGPTADASAPDVVTPDASVVDTGGDTPTSTPDADLGPIEIPASITRLTRAEYLRKIDDAFGWQMDPALLPFDGRVDHYTSNESTFPDPVYPYLTAAENAAAVVVPDGEGCASNIAACLQTEYGTSLELLLQRALTSGEYDGWAARMQGLLDQDVNATEATRSVLLEALLHPDFLFRPTAPSGAAQASLHRFGGWLSMALWDGPPDLELVSWADQHVATARAQLGAETRRLLADARARAPMVRFVSQWLGLDYDQKVFEQPAFANASPTLELVAGVAHALEQETPVKSLISGDVAFAHPDQAAAYGVDADPAILPVQWPADSSRRGMLGHEWFGAETRHPDPSRRVIFRGLAVREQLLCGHILPPSAEFIAMAGEVDDRVNHPTCGFCHEQIDPIGDAFAVLDGEAPTSAIITNNDELNGTYGSLPELLTAIAESRTFAECFSRNWLAFTFEMHPDLANAALVAQLADAVEDGASLADVAALTATLAFDHMNDTAICEAP